ncbi:MAG: sulfatase-like hydrolase/transferase [Candidatus Altiarchaeales archaeon]|nr:sulfatase-like hydrolase/transferase [Candidatus Altiarchaeales archaeon]
MARKLTLRQKTILVACLLFLAVAFRLASKPDTFDPVCRGCNVVLISIDTLRADHLGCYGYGKNTTPNIDEIAKESLLFENTHSTSSWTYPAHFTILTGKTPAKKQLFVFNGIEAFGGQQQTLAEILNSRGYETAAFTGGGFVSEELGFGQGFNTFVSRGRRFEDNQKSLLEWLGDNHFKRFFLFIHGYNCHRPYEAPGEYKNMFVTRTPAECENVSFKDTERPKFRCRETKEGLKYMKARYDGEIFYADKLIGQVLEVLRDVGVYENTIIVITSDHGEEFAEHGGFDHVNTLYEEVLHVPLLIRIPGVGSRRFSCGKTNTQIFPAILKLLGFEGWEGASLLSESESSLLALTGRRGVIAEKIEGGEFIKYSLIEDNLKIIKTTVGEGDPEKYYEVYDLREDPGEKNNLFSVKKYDKQGIRLQARLEYQLNRLNESGIKKTGYNPLEDEEIRGQLRALGYLD